MVIPLSDDDSQLRLTPVVTFGLLVANLVVFLLQLAQPDIETFFRTWAVIPIEYARRVDLAPTHAGPYWITVVTSMFMHGGILHLAGNMLFLWIFGDNVEEAMGHLRFLAFYLICGSVATIAQIAMGPQSQIPNLGASGAISGILGAYLIMFPRQRVRVLIIRVITYMPAIVVIGLWIFFQLISGLGQLGRMGETGGVAYAAHIGGFLAGFALVHLFRR
jgi:membrane associated rhomboid family serine protease